MFIVGVEQYEPPMKILMSVWLNCRTYRSLPFFEVNGMNKSR